MFSKKVSIRSKNVQQYLCAINHDCKENFRIEEKIFKEMHKIGSNLKYFVFISYVNKYNEMYELKIKCQ